MKIICIEGNYRKEENKEIAPEEPVFFIKPETSLLRNKQPFFIPDHSKQIIPRVNIVVKICRLGKNIQEKFASRYYEEIGIGIDMEATDVLQRAKKHSLPWEQAKAYDYSSPIGNFIPKNKIANLQNLSFSLYKNGNILVQANSAEMLFTFDRIISYVSKYVMLKMGDYIYTGSPEIKEVLEINDTIECAIDNKKLLSIKIK